MLLYLFFTSSTVVAGINGCIYIQFKASLFLRAGEIYEEKGRTIQNLNHSDIKFGNICSFLRDKFSQENAQISYSERKTFYISPGAENSFAGKDHLLGEPGRSKPHTGCCTKTKIPKNCSYFASTGLLLVVKSGVVNIRKGCTIVMLWLAVD